MKPKPVVFAFLFCLTGFFSTGTFAQTVPGGSIECPTSCSIKKNNGGGMCHGDAMVSVVFTPNPSAVDIPLLTGIYYNGQIVSCVYPVQGSVVSKKDAINISYCLTESASKNTPLKNVPPAGKLILEFTYQDGTVCKTNTTN
jgi:hypothetical protein